ncbi:hypothetical protein M404DRAFT_904268 [Pisolithus tinctorius Marx 270]|uniref:Uncharacterized protein n=1 Tax=Pisolithus tinctorius Marx 270 TaxID=870435 RepID=A0A0C3P9W6_PISTI|nr:hypothetical protein M404DRAFT_904268 [Pisolithus tinctorius Marx 270]
MANNRPVTSAGRPRTAGPPAFDHDTPYDHNTYIAEEDDEDDESDAGDLFAFLPPSTADQQRDESLQQHFSPSPDYPIFDPYARFPANAAGPSSRFTPPISSQPVESPPSTASQQGGAHDPYRMRRLSNPRTGTAETRPSGTSSRDIHVNLPSSPREKSLEVEYSEIPSRKRHPSSTIGPDTTTLSLTPSMLEQDSRDGSIKCVLLLVPHLSLMPPY